MVLSPMSPAWWHAALAAALATATVQSVEAAPPCDLAIVGAGAGGAYAAWRAAASGRKVCVFERSMRPGGRIHSLRNQGPKQDLVVEAGGYRFAPKEVVQHFGNVTWRINTPLTAAIVRELKLPTKIYNPNPSQWDHGMRVIVDDHGEDAGYLTLVETMLHRAESSGAVVRFGAEVVGLGLLGAKPSEGMVVRIKNGEEFAASDVMLNLPQRPAIELLRRSGGAVSSVFPRPLYDPVSFPLFKFYVHYDDAWWVNDLGHVSGAFYNTAPAEKVPGHVPDLSIETPAPLQGQYHDGHVRCDLPGNRCRGFLQAYYGSDHTQDGDGINGALKFYTPFGDSISEDSATFIKPGASHHKELLEQVHAALLALHKPQLDAVNATARVAAMRPTEAVLSIWSDGVQGIHAGCHQPKLKPSGEAPVPGELAKAAMQPLPGWPIYVANEAYGPMGCFAEGSLAMSEAVLTRLGVPLPPSGWLQQELVEALLEPEASIGRPPTDPFLLPKLWREEGSRPAAYTATPRDVVNII